MPSPINRPKSFGRCGSRIGWFATLAAYHEKLPDLFKSKGSARAYLEPEQRKFYDDLPDEVTIYRGCDLTLTGGVSWTTDRKIAERFASSGRYGRPDVPVIITANIKKRSSRLYYCEPGRNEKEIVCRPRSFASIDDAGCRELRRYTG